VPYSLFFPFRKIEENGLLNCFREYSLAYIAEKVTLLELDKMLEIKKRNLQIIINRESDSFMFIPNIRIDRRTKKKELPEHIEALKTSMVGDKLSGVEYLKLVQSFLNRENTCC
jgi:hypothetical protein